MTLRQKLFGFRGRLRRRDWWILAILVGLAQIVTTFALASFVSAANLTQSDTPMTLLEALASIPDYIAWPIQLAFLWPTFALSVQRFHDRGASAWPVVVYYAVINFADYIPGSETSWTSGLDPALVKILSFAWPAAWLLLALWFLIKLGFADGTPGPNRFGPSPKVIESPGD